MTTRSAILAAVQADLEANCAPDARKTAYGRRDWVALLTPVMRTPGEWVPVLTLQHDDTVTFDRNGQGRVCRRPKSYALANYTAKNLRNQIRKPPGRWSFRTERDTVLARYEGKP